MNPIVKSYKKMKAACQTIDYKVEK